MFETDTQATKFLTLKNLAYYLGYLKARYDYPRDYVAKYH